MLVLVGLIIVFGSVILGYVRHHGNLHVLLQVNEFIIIGGAAGGAFLITCTPKTLVKTLKSIPRNTARRCLRLETLRCKRPLRPYEQKGKYPDNE